MVSTSYSLHIAEQSINYLFVFMGSLTVWSRVNTAGSVAKLWWLKRHINLGVGGRGWDGRAVPASSRGVCDLPQAQASPTPCQSSRASAGIHLQRSTWPESASMRKSCCSCMRASSRPLRMTIRFRGKRAPESQRDGNKSRGCINSLGGCINSSVFKFWLWKWENVYVRCKMGTMGQVVFWVG